MKNFSKLILSCAVFATMFVGAGQAKADLINNGSFETPVNVHGPLGNDMANQNFVDYAAPTDLTALAEYNTDPGALLTDWTVVDGSVDIVNQSTDPYGWDAFQGVQSLDLNGWDPGTISQAFGTVQGTQYTLSFEYSNNPWNGGTDSALVTVGNQSMQLVHSGSTPTNMGWILGSLQFTGTGAPMTVTFTSENGGTGGIALDAVSVTSAGQSAAAPVPEPSSFALLGLGGIGLAFCANRRRRAAVV